jgi:hypothetical protein
LLVVLYGFEDWFLTVRGKRRFRVFENRVLRRIFRPEREDVTGGWRKLHDYFNNWHSSPYYYVDQINEDGADGNCSTPEKEKKCIQKLYVRKS